MDHEGTGVVDAVRENVTHVSIGDHVVIHYVDSCGNCKPCLRGNDHRCRHRGHLGDHRHGTFAEYVTIPGRGALRIVDSVPFEWASIAACAVATPYHAAQRSRMKNWKTVIIFGTGGVGTHAVMWANFLGAAQVPLVDIDRDHRPPPRPPGVRLDLFQPLGPAGRPPLRRLRDGRWRLHRPGGDPRCRRGARRCRPHGRGLPVDESLIGGP